jgi:hypothetical protein
VSSSSPDDHAGFACRHRGLASTLFTAIGVLLVLLGAVHLVALPWLRDWFISVVGRGSPTEPALLLDHVISVPLLTALGILTAYAARALANGAVWARVVCLTSASVVVTLPIATIAVVPADYLRGPAFAVAVAILGIATALAVVAVVATLKRGAR